MLTESLHDYLILAEHLNITKAASVLHMSQSTLSRHIASLENELGYQLLVRDTNRLALTPAGQLFADRIDLVLSQISAIVDECRVVADQGSRVLTVLDPPYHDEAADLFFTTLNKASEAHPSTNYNYVTLYRKDLHEALSDNDIDIAVFYRYGNAEEELAALSASGLETRWLGNERFSVFFDRESPLANLSFVPVEELAQYPILSANDLYRPLGSAIHGLFDAYGQTPTFKLVNTQSQTEFLQYRCKPAVFIMPSGMVEDSRFRTRFDLESRPIGDEQCLINFYIITSNRYAASHVLDLVGS